jgi:hypothetical protein
VIHALHEHVIPILSRVPRRAASLARRASFRCLFSARVALESWITQHYTHRILNVLVIPLQVSSSSHCTVYNTQHYTHRILNVLVIPLQLATGYGPSVLEVTKRILIRQECHHGEH